MSKNEITGDLLINKKQNENYRNNYDLIFKKNKECCDSTLNIKKEIFDINLNCIPIGSLMWFPVEYKEYEVVKELSKIYKIHFFKI